MIGLLLLFFLSLLLLSVTVHTKNIRNELARLAVGTFFLVEYVYRTKCMYNKIIVECVIGEQAK